MLPMDEQKKSISKFILCICLCFAAICATCLMSACAQTSASSSATETADTSKKDSDNKIFYTVEEEISYSDGIHHAEMIFEGYEDSPLEIELYAHSAWRTVQKFCRLVDRGYYNGKPVFWILNEMYLRVGNPVQDNEYLISGEYEESDVKNSNSLKRGVIAMNRSLDGQQSDASSLIIFMTDLSFLDGKYAGFAKITKNYEVIEQIAQRTIASDDSIRIDIDENGRIIDEAKYPRIKTITIID